MAKEKNEFDGQFKADCQFSFVPMVLLTLISELIDGGNVEHKGYSQSALSISQLIMYNFRKQSTNHISTHH